MARLANMVPYTLKKIELMHGVQESVASMVLRCVLCVIIG